jgi:glycosyltransferase involved in cell wall biosynthesis
MTQISGSAYKIAAYTSDLWEHVCPTIRLIEPISEAGMQLIKGNEWDNGPVQVRLNPIEEADIVVIQRDFPKNVEAYEDILAYAHRLRKPVIYELDDNLIELGISHPDVNNYLEPRPSILRAVLEADAVTTSTAQLADYLRVFNPNVYILPNFLIDKYWMRHDLENAPSKDQGSITIGYMGGHSHAPDVEMIAPVLERLLDRYGDQISLQFWGLHPGDELLKRPNVHWTHPYLVKYLDFAQYFIGQTCDIFIAPLQDNLFNRCKSGLKYLEYSTPGIPGVYSNIPPYNDLIKNGENGFLANHLDEWESNISQLIENADLRIRMGSAAQSDVEKRWLLSQNAYRWQDAYRQILNGDSNEPKIISDNAHQVIRKVQKWYIDLAQRARFQQNRIHELNEMETQLKTNEKSIALQFEADVKKLETQVQITELAKSTLQIKNEQQQQLVDQLEETVESLGNQIIEKNREVSRVENSLTWKFTLKLFRARQILAPDGSLLERLLRFTLDAFLIWRHLGFRTMLSRIKTRSLQKTPIQSPNLVVAPQYSGIHYVAADGITIKSPALTVLHLLSESHSEVIPEQVTGWLDRQTLSSWEYIQWDLNTGKAWQSNQPDRMWVANDISALKIGLLGKYACIVSPDLLQQNETYLENNLVALASEDLVFTVNINGNAEWTRYYFERGVFPGSKLEPLQRMCVSVNSLEDNFAIDLTNRFKHSNEKTIVVGKILSHTTPEMDLEGLLCFDYRLDQAAVTIWDRSIVARPKSNQLNPDTTHVIHPVDQVLPVIESGSDRPTVLVFMPFLAVGGAERVALDMIDYLKDDIRFVVVTLDDHDPAIGTTVNAFRKLTPLVYTARDFLNFNLNFSFINYLIQKYQPYTFYIANGSPWIFDALMTIKHFHPELRFACQVYDHQAGWINRYDPNISKIIDANIGVNKKICDTYVEKGVRQKAVYQIENGVNTIEFDPDLYDEQRKISIKQKLNIEPEKKIIVFMARLHAQKRPMDFVEVARRCSEDPNLHFLMVGNGPLATVIDDEIEKIGLKNITRLSFYRPSSDIFSICDVYVLPSEYEGMPMVILEAQAMGKPVVVTNVGNNREVLDITNGGVCVNKIGSIGELREGIYQMLNSPTATNTARQAVLDHFSMKVMGEKYREALLGK